ncbi:MAG TPA: hypothetical protein VIL89_00990 [Clostridia bacterium]
MEWIFQRILEIENRAKEVFNEAVNEGELVKKALLEEIDKKKFDIKLLADERIYQLITQSKKETSEKLNHLDKVLKEKLLFLEQLYERNKEEWENNIYINVIGE